MLWTVRPGWTHSATYTSQTALPFRTPTNALHEACQLLGLAADQEKVYTELHHAGRATAGEMARLVGMSRAMAYRTLRELASLGLVREVPDRPIRFSAVDARSALRAAASMAAATAHRYEEVAKALPERRSDAPPTQWCGPEDVTLLSGRRAVQQEMRRMLDRTQRIFAICGPGLVAHRLAGNSDLLWGMREAAGRGVRTAVLVPSSSDPVALERLRQELGEGRIVVMSPAVMPFIKYIVNDEAMLAVIVQPDDTDPRRGHDLGIRVESRSMVNNTIRNLQRMGAQEHLAPLDESARPPPSQAQTSARM